MIEFVKVHPEVPTPRRAHPTDAGVDLTAWSIDLDGLVNTGWDSDVVQPGHARVYGTGVRVAIPTGYVGLLFARSSLGVKRRLDVANGTGVIDADYRGEVKVCLRNTGTHATRITRGERVAQMVVVPALLDEWVEVDTLDETTRGEGGYGSTGH